MFYVYILQLNNKEYYTGFTNDLRKRFECHSKGYVITTKDKIPITLVYYSAFSSRTVAIAFERYLKSSSGFAFRNKHLL